MIKFFYDIEGIYKLLNKNLPNFNIWQAVINLTARVALIFQELKINTNTVRYHAHVANKKVRKLMRREPHTYDVYTANEIKAT